MIDSLQFVRRGRAYLLGYAILPDHLHVLLIPRGRQTISGLMQGILLVLSTPERAVAAAFGSKASMTV